MPRITVVTTVTTTFDVPEGVTITQVRHLALQDLNEMDELTNSVSDYQDRAINRVYHGAADGIRLSVEHAISEGVQPLNPA
ncbi:hypothetical protein ACIPL1_22810 [Pseudomonas sp. NPDC090202]|uniref:hypothetical protein n=1 Tax=Pseudomonas sp. NPDC090202 TaxID=3364476 RepID=UPI0037FE1328